jgi:hypothetical protein
MDNLYEVSLFASCAVISIGGTIGCVPTPANRADNDMSFFVSSTG